VVLHGFDHNLPMLKILSAPTSAMLWPGAWAAAVWCAAAASVVFWVLHISSVDSVQAESSMQTADPTMTAAPSAKSSAFLNRALGVQSPMPEISTVPSTRVQLWGVVAGASGRGSALISVDGLPARAFRVGQTVTDDLVLQSLGPKQALLGASPKGATLLTISLPELGKTP
jgi:general secretion pathway protein C